MAWRVFNLKHEVFDRCGDGDAAVGHAPDHRANAPQNGVEAKLIIVVTAADDGADTR